MSKNNGDSNNGTSTSLRLKTGLAEMLKGGVIMDVTNAEQASIAEKAGAVAVMALERVPAQIRAEGGVARMASPRKIREIMEAVSIPVIASGGAGTLDDFVEVFTAGRADADDAVGDRVARSAPAFAFFLDAEQRRRFVDEHAACRQPRRNRRPGYAGQHGCSSSAVWASLW